MLSGREAVLCGVELVYVLEARDLAKEQKNYSLNSIHSPSLPTLSPTLGTLMKLRVLQSML